MPTTRHPQLKALQPPNPAKPHVRRRLEASIVWAETNLHLTIPRPILEKKIAAALGQNQHLVSRWIRSVLLASTGHYTPGLRSKKYTLRVDGIARIRHLLDGVAPAPEHYTAQLGRVYAAQLATHRYEYWNTNRGRLGHTLQQIKSIDAAAFWTHHGLAHGYDINAAAPTVIYQMALRAGLTPIWMTAILDYLENKDDWHRHVMALTGGDLPTASAVITSLFRGRRGIGPSPLCLLYRDVLGGDDAALRALLDDPRIRRLRTTIARAWVRILVAGGHPKLGKWATYLREERRIVDAAMVHLDVLGVKHFTMHAGFVTDRQIDTTALSDAVFYHTGYRLVFVKSDRAVSGHSDSITRRTAGTLPG